MELFDRFKVSWSRLHQTSAEGLAEDEAFYLVTGRYQAETEEARVRSWRRRRCPGVPHRLEQGAQGAAQADR